MAYPLKLILFVLTSKLHASWKAEDLLMAALLKSCWSWWEQKIMIHFNSSGFLRASLLYKGSISVLAAHETTAKQRRKVWDRTQCTQNLKVPLWSVFCCEALPSNMRRALKYKMCSFCAEQVYLLWGGDEAPAHFQKQHPVTPCEHLPFTVDLEHHIHCPKFLQTCHHSEVTQPADWEQCHRNYFFKL